MKLPNAFLVLPLLLAASACAASGARTPEAGSPPPAGGKGDDAEGAADKITKKERELEYAKIELEIAKLSAAADSREAENTVTDATQKLDTAKKDRENFKDLEKPNKLADKQLDLDRAAWRMEESKQELAELEGMYKKEDFASLTKELVLQRGKKSLEFAQRGLELAKKDQEGLAGHDLPKKETELDQAFDRAEKGVQEANAKKDRVALETKLKLTKAEHHVDEAQRELEKARSKDKDKAPGKASVAAAKP